MSIIERQATTFNTQDECPGCWCDYPGDPGMWCDECLQEWSEQFDREPQVETTEWIEAQADRIRSLGSDLAELVADQVAELARTWRVVSHDEPITVETFKARCEVLARSSQVR